MRRLSQAPRKLTTSSSKTMTFDSMEMIRRFSKSVSTSVRRIVSGSMRRSKVSSARRDVMPEGLRADVVGRQSFASSKRVSVSAIGALHLDDFASPRSGGADLPDELTDDGDDKSSRRRQSHDGHLPPQSTRLCAFRCCSALTMSESSLALTAADVSRQQISLKRATTFSLAHSYPPPRSLRSSNMSLSRSGSSESESAGTSFEGECFLGVSSSRL